MGLRGWQGLDGPADLPEPRRAGVPEQEQELRHLREEAQGGAVHQNLSQEVVKRALHAIKAKAFTVSKYS